MLRHSDGINPDDVKPLKKKLLDLPLAYDMIEGYVGIKCATLPYGMLSQPHGEST